MLTAAENFTMLELARDVASETRQTVEAMQGVGANKTSRDLAAALANLLNVVAKKLDATD